ncbi:MAG: histidine triad nucleotide-binding protein [Actinomycetota bacterium]|nr:histidine triad nucleotide-binding protein [Actinomycetota bacterium]
MEECLFCRIINKEVGCDILEERPLAIAFRDVNPQAPVHIIVLPKEHISSLRELDTNRCDVLSEIFSLINDLAVSEGIAQSGYRVVTNVGEEAGQAIDHLHFHLLGGRFMMWPPG